MDPEEYRRNYAAQIKADERAAAAKRGRGRGQRAGTPRAGLGVGASVGAANPNVMSAIGNKAERNDERIAAIDDARLDATSHPTVINLLITVLQDSSDDPTVRRAALGALRENSFRIADFSPYAADYRNALRAAATDDDPELREQVLEILALDKDEYAQRLLVEGLRDRKKALVRPERAVQFIGYDLHAEHYDLLRTIVSTSKKAGLRNGALRLLAADADSKNLFMEIARDRSESTQARSVSVAALTSLAPEEFAPVARDIVLDDTDNDAVRAASLTALSHGPNQSGSAGLAERVLAAPTKPSRHLARAARQVAVDVGRDDG